MKVFVAGATGVIGSRAVNQLVAAGHEVTGIARSEEKAAQMKSWGATAARVDLFDPPAVRQAAAGHDAVANLATHIPRTTKAAFPGVWRENDRIRTEGSRILVDAALATGAAIYIQESITFVYEDRGDQWIDESTPVTIVPYVQSVLDAQANTDRFAEGGGSGVYLRFGMFYAADSHHMHDLFTFARRGLAMDPSRPEAYKSMVHADDAAAAVVAALGAPSGLYNVCEDDPMTSGEQRELVARLVGRTKLRNVMGAVTWVAGSKAEILKRSQRISNRLFKETTGWAPNYPSLDEGYPAVYEELAQIGMAS